MKKMLFHAVFHGKSSVIFCEGQSRRGREVRGGHCQKRKESYEYPFDGRQL